MIIFLLSHNLSSKNLKHVCVHITWIEPAVCNDRTAFVTSRVTGCAAQNLFAPEHSDVCLTAIHAGLLTNTGGQFSVQTSAAGIDYQGCIGNGTVQYYIMHEDDFSRIGIKSH